MRTMLKVLGLLALVILAAVVVVALQFRDRDDGPAQDEAMAAGKTPADFPHASNDFFHEMDGGVQLTPAQVRGRNTWLVWTAGNEAFWDYLANHSFGTFDLLKTLSSYPCSPQQQQQLAAARARNPQTLPDYGLYARHSRFTYLGLMNEPDFEQPTTPDDFGLCLDKSARATPDFDERVYGRASGVLGLRLYPNPNFDAAARAKWDPVKFYTDPNYYSDGNLVRPYRVGMSCGFCHISHHPLNPPADPENPAFRNLSATIGAQYFWFGRIFAANLTPKSFVWHLVDSAQPGALDTSFIPTDHINNPRAMNAIFNLKARLDIGARLHKETASGGALSLPQVKKVQEQTGSATLGVPHVLWDGADSVGIDAALTRVFINIGEYHQEWIRHIQPIVGGRPQSPIEVSVAQKYSTFWNATQERSRDLADYLIAASAPMHLADAPGGKERLQGNRSQSEYDKQLERGKVVFAETCARCHSSKLPSPLQGLDDAGCIGSDYGNCWKKYWDWTETEDFKSKMRPIVQAADFLENNYLATDARVPVTQLETEVCSSMASNALEGYVWDNFSSESYKSLPSVGEVKVEGPNPGQVGTWETPGGGRGYQRVASLIGIWATAPFLHDNVVGATYRENRGGEAGYREPSGGGSRSSIAAQQATSDRAPRYSDYGAGGAPVSLDPSVEGRLAAFDDAIHKLLWPERRDHTVWRTRPVETSEGKTDGVTWLNVYTSGLPRGLQMFVGDGFAPRTLRSVLGLDSLVEGGMVQIGPIPAGTPVNLLANINVDRNDPRFSVLKLLRLLNRAKSRLKEIDREKLDMTQATARLKELEPDLLQLSTCPDFVVDRGHNFGSTLPDDDKNALIEFVKTF